ncbi:MAG: signal recognition particle-docking protein FtsY [Pseudomonadota bacterium]
MAKSFLSGLFGKKDKPEEKPAPEEERDSAAPPTVDETPPALPSEGIEREEKDDAPSPQPTPAAPTAFDAALKLRNAEADTPPPAEEPAPEAAEPQITKKTDEPPLRDTASADDLGKIAEAAAAEDAKTDTTKKKTGWLSRLRQGLSKSSSKLTEGVAAIFTKRKLDDDAIEELQDLLITADLGVAAATRMTDALAKEKFDKEVTDQEVRQALATDVTTVLSPLEKPLALSSPTKPHIILMTGVNGAGKTTTIGKLAQKFRDDGKSVMLAAGDTFRAAAIEQLAVWGERTGAPVISRDVGADAAGLAFDAVQQAREDNVDVLIIDTAGRLQNKSALMDELAKIVRVLKKLDPDAPHDVLLVLDATVGQNAVSQADAFREIAGVTGLVMTKLDGTARGGVLVALADKFGLPVHYIGVGESVDDLQPFDAHRFAAALCGVDE